MATVAAVDSFPRTEVLDVITRTGKRRIEILPLPDLLWVSPVQNVAINT